MCFRAAEWRYLRRRVLLGCLEHGRYGGRNDRRAYGSYTPSSRAYAELSRASVRREFISLQVVVIVIVFVIVAVNDDRPTDPQG